MHLKALFTFLSSFIHVALGGWSPVCRFTPSCSQYAAQAVETHGWFRGLVLVAKRLCRCRPGASWGADPVPTLGSDKFCGHKVLGSHQ